MGYHRLTLEDRYQIEALLNSGMSLRAIGRQLHRAGSTILRETNKGTGCGGYYRATYSQSKTLRYLHAPHLKTRKIKAGLKNHIRTRLEQDWSPEQIVGRRKYVNEVEPLSTPTLYRFLRREKVKSKVLWNHLRILRRERQDRKRVNYKPKLYLPDRVFIDQRPKVVERRNRLGDYERDTVLGKRGGVVLLTAVDRTSRLLRLAVIPKNTSYAVHRATVRILKNEPLKTITNDNGFEFIKHKATAKSLKVPIYFNDTYKSWQRGTNENTNGLLRQYFPKKTAIPLMQRKELKRFEDLINNRPRKCLGYRTPLEVHNELKRQVLR